MSGPIDSGGGGRSQDFEVNITPIIDFFTVLIAFLLLSASFIAIGVFDAGIAAGGAASTQKSDPPPITINVSLEANHALTLKVTGKANQNVSIQAANGTWNYDELTKHLEGLKAKWPMVSGMTLTADNSIEYKNVIDALGAARKTIPNVLLGGF